MTVMGITQRSGEVWNCLLTGTMTPPVNWAGGRDRYFDLRLSQYVRY
jgi:hypothetical protein